jgi:TPR repeat protein
MSTWLQEAEPLAMEGLTPYQIQLGHSYLTGFDPDGNPFSIDFDKARTWLERAHAKGAFTATYLLGTIHEEGKGVTVDTSRAIGLYEQAAARGAFYASLRLARIYASGAGVSASTEQARRWYQQVVDAQGDVDDQGAINEAKEFLEVR